MDRSCWPPWAIFRAARRGRQQISDDTIELIRRMVRENRLWGAERIRGEPLKLSLYLGSSYLTDNSKPKTSTSSEMLSWKKRLSRTKSRYSASRGLKAGSVVSCATTQPPRFSFG